MKYNFFLILSSFFITVVFCHDLNSNDEKSRFLEGINIENKEAQDEVNRLKQDFYNEKEKINSKYELRVKSFKKNRKDEIVRLRKKYKQRLKGLRKKYPDIPKLDIDPKPIPKPRPPKKRYDENSKKKLDKNQKDKRQKKRIYKNKNIDRNKTEKSTNKSLNKKNNK